MQIVVSMGFLWFELCNVVRYENLFHWFQVRKQRAMLGLDKGDVEAPVSEAFLNYKTASVVFNQAIKIIPG